MIELKGPKVHLDRDRSNGRTAVGQCWDYLVNTPPECRWGIVSNIVSFRLYERASTKRAYEHFTLQSLRDFDVFKQFYVLFHRQGLIDESLLGPPRAVALLKKSTERQRKVGDELYEAYSRNRTELIAELHYQAESPAGRGHRNGPAPVRSHHVHRLLRRSPAVAREDDPQGLHRGRLSRRHQSPLAEVQEPVSLHQRRQRNLRHSPVQRRAVRAARRR